MILTFLKTLFKLFFNNVGLLLLILYFDIVITLINKLNNIHYYIQENNKKYKYLICAQNKL